MPKFRVHYRTTRLMQRSVEIDADDQGEAFEVAQGMRADVLDPGEWSPVFGGTEAEKEALANMTIARIEQVE